MAELNSEQLELQQEIKSSAIKWGIVLGIILGLLAYWILGSQDANIRIGGAVGVGLVSAFLIFRSTFNAKAKSAKCGQCSATFSIEQKEKKETLVASEDKTERTEHEDGSVVISSWTEEKFDVVNVYECSACGNLTEKTQQETRNSNQESETIPAPAKKPSASKDKGSTKSKKQASRTAKK